MNIYELSEEYQSKLEQLAEREEKGELVSNEEAIELLDLKNDVKNKIVATAKYIANRTAEANAISDAKSRLSDRQEAINNDIKRNKERLLFIMSMLNIQGVNDPVMPVRRQAHKSSVVIDDITLIPDDYKQTETVVKINKTKLFEDCKNKSIAGVHLEHGEHIRIG